MPDEHDHSSKRSRTAPPPFIGPPRPGALPPKARADRPTLPPFSPPFVRRPSPAVPIARAAEESGAVLPSTPRPQRLDEAAAPAWLDAVPNDSGGGAESGAAVPVGWVNPDEPSGAAPPQAATGIDWLDSPAPQGAGPAVAPAPSQEELDDVFGWDPAEERAGALNVTSSSPTLEALKELEPWALPGGEPSVATSDDIPAALERVAARIRSGDLFVPGAPAGATDEAVLAAVLAALLQRARG